MLSLIISLTALLNNYKLYNSVILITLHGKKRRDFFFFLKRKKMERGKAAENFIIRKVEKIKVGLGSRAV